MTPLVLTAGVQPRNVFPFSLKVADTDFALADGGGVAVVEH